MEQGFTRLELWAVTLGLTLLGTGLVPQVVGRDRAVGVRCLANQRQLVLAFLSYAEDHEGRILRPVMPTTVSAGGYWPGPQSGITAGLTRKEAQDRVEAGLREGAYWRYLPDAEAYHCPEDLRSILKEPGRGWAMDSYSKASGLSMMARADSPFISTLAGVPVPSMALAFVEESDPRGYNSGPWVLDVTSPSWVDPLAIFHDGGSTFGFVDGHVEMRYWRDPETVRSAQASAQGTPSFSWSGGNLQNPDFRWVFSRFQYAGWKPIVD
jgi:prepilin-type processing-associated H-X9-DG protein